MPARSSAIGTLLVAAVFSASARAQALLYEIDGTHDSRHFGWTVANAGDVDGDGVTDFAAGDYDYDPTGSSDNWGRVRVYSGRTAEVLRTWIGEVPQEHFGETIVAVGDVDGDGRSDLAIGSPGFGAPGLATQGRVRVFSGGSGAPLFEVARGVLSHEYVGEALAAADVNHDGALDYILGSRTPADRRGRVRVFSGSGGALLHDILGTSASDYFGLAVSGAGDVDLDGHDDFIVGSLQDGSTPAAGVGSAYVYSGSTGALLFKLADVCRNDVAGIGDVNADGRADVAVGFDIDDLPGVYHCGSVSAFSGADGSLLFKRYGDYANDLFGTRVGAAGDVNGDGRPDVIACAYHNPASGGLVQVGKVRIFSGADGSTLSTLYGSQGAGDLLGLSLDESSLGDLNGDGFDDFVLGTQPRWLDPDGYGRVQVFLSGVASPTTYCTAKINSLGCTPEIAVSGLASLSVGNNLMVTATQVLNRRAGKLIWSLGTAETPFGGGTLCLAPTIHRTPVLDSGGSPFPANDCSGIYSFHFSQAYLTLNGLGSGTTVYCQFWSRDGGFPAPNNMGLTDAASFVVVP